MIIRLENIKLKAYHGWYEQEQQTGNWFETSVMIEVQDKEINDNDLNSTFNYEVIYQIVTEEMAIPCRLLETVGKAIMTRIKSFEEIIKAELTIYKLAPEKMKFVDKVGIQLNFQR
jgi:dihydroneopterin aldolase